MHSATPRLRTFLASILVLAAIAGCGASSSAQSGGPTTVAEVAGQKITKAYLDHWIHIEAIISGNQLPQEVPPPGVVPDPPHYTACIAYLKSLPSGPGRALVPTTTAQAKTDCRQHYEHVSQHMLQIMISKAWTKRQTEELGIHVTPQEVQRTFTRFKREEYPTETIFQNYLKASGSTIADELWLEEFDMLSGKMGKTIIRRGLPAAKKFYQEFPKHWAAQTNCNPEYIIPDCKQYKGPKSPEPSI